MIPAVITGWNRTFKKPDQMSDEECRDLKVRVQRFQIGSGRECFAFTSAWSPTPQELEAIQAGANIELTIIGMSHPPISISVGTPPPAAG